MVLPAWICLAMPALCAVPLSSTTRRTTTTSARTSTTSSIRTTSSSAGSSRSTTSTTLQPVSTTTSVVPRSTTGSVTSSSSTTLSSSFTSSRTSTSVTSVIVTTTTPRSSSVTSSTSSSVTSRATSSSASASSSSSSSAISSTTSRSATSSTILSSAVTSSATSSTTARSSSSSSTSSSAVTSSSTISSTTSGSSTTSSSLTSAVISSSTTASTTLVSSTSSSSATTLGSSTSSSLLSSSVTSSSALSASITSSLSSTTLSSSSTLLSSSSTTSSSVPTTSSSVPFNGNIQSTILIIARDATSAGVAARGLNGYGIPYEFLIVPQAGVSLPALNSSGVGNYGGIIVVGGVVYDYGTAGFTSALTTAQWSQLYAYQTDYSVRMVEYGLFPTAEHGVTALGGCCAAGVEQLISLTNTDAFAQAGLKKNAGVSTSGLYHYPATIINTTTTTEIAQFAASSDGTYAGTSSAAVINNFNGRENMVFFLDFAQDWSATSGFLQHAYITWITRGLYAGYRRINLGTQIDDVMLGTDIYYPATAGSYRTTVADLNGIAAWIPTINAKMPAGSSYRPELGYNGNGNIIASEATTNGATTCAPGSIEYDTVPDTALEFQKPLGSGANFWPTTPTTYPYSAACLNLDPLSVWFQTAANHAKFYHISHTFTHLELNNATHDDALKEIQFNQNWLSKTGISASGFSANALIPPAITGLHNGDVLQAWTEAGLTNCVGDNTRPVLRNTQNEMWPLITTVAGNGFAGFQVNPRWATRIYYNCDTGSCTTQEWIVTSAGVGTFNDLLAVEKADTMRHLFGLYHDPYMFHQANLRNTGSIGTTTINGVTSTISIFQAWVETIVQEFVRLADWPIITLGQTDFAASFAARMARDQCNYKLAYTVNNKQITAVTLTATNNQCSSPIPVTVPGSVTNTQGFKTEKVGNDPLTIWVTLSGSPVSFTLSSPVSLL